MKAILLTGLGHFFLLLGVIGAFLPILPSTPFVLLACSCYMRGSERFHRALVGNRWFGPSIQNWRREGSISFRAKFIAVGALLATVNYSFAVSDSAPLKGALAVIAIGVSLFILSRPYPAERAGEKIHVDV